MRLKSSISEIDAQIEKLRERKKALLVKANERFARAASKAGLAELEIPDNELDTIFQEIAARFHDGASGRTGRSTQKDRPAHRGTGATAQVFHDE